ncbi:hypothetical protein C4588_03980 [Candidatus Parcubacteria bacterium]|nr:MAG: hypothetical protein C4588_03980 [Candidatus Parcubacteria bacterium]
MLKQPTGKTFTKTTQVVLSIDENRVETVYPGQEPFEVINNLFYKARNSRWQLCNMVEEMEVFKAILSGSSYFSSEGATRIGEPRLEVVKEWIWTGKQFKEVLQ